MDDIKNCPESERPYKNRNIPLNPVSYKFDTDAKICTFHNLANEIIAHTKFITCIAKTTGKPYFLCNRQWILGDKFIAYNGGFSELSKREKNDYFRVYQRKLRIYLS